MQDAFSAKLDRVREWMRREAYATLVLSRIDNLFWLCGADTHVGLNSDAGVAAVVITADSVTAVTTNIEAPRLRDEELGRLGVAVEAVAWWSGDPGAVIKRLADPDGPVAGDVPAAGRALANLAPLRYQLLPDEVAEYRALGAAMGRALGAVAWALRPGETEFQVAGRVAAALLADGITPTVLLVAADERIARYRHPIPTDRAVDRRVMLVAGGRRGGRIVSLSRLVSFGPLDAGLRRRHDAVCQVDAAFIGATLPGVRVGAAFEAGVQAYAAAGFADEWQHHHQGGATGYAGRDYRATPTCNEIVQPWQAFAWNPSIAGTKSEDTMLATPDGPEIISASPDWPLVAVSAGGRRFARPDILVR